jgi:hypothetical protein
MWLVTLVAAAVHAAYNAWAYRASLLHLPEALGACWTCGAQPLSQSAQPQPQFPLQRAGPGAALQVRGRCRGPARPTWGHRTRRTSAWLPLLLACRDSRARTSAGVIACACGVHSCGRSGCVCWAGGTAILAGQRRGGEGGPRGRRGRPAAADKPGAARAPPRPGGRQRWPRLAATRSCGTAARCRPLVRCGAGPCAAKRGQRRASGRRCARRGRCGRGEDGGRGGRDRGGDGGTRRECGHAGWC